MLAPRRVERDPSAIRLDPIGGAVGLSWRGAVSMLPLFTPFVLVLVVGCANVANLLLARAVNAAARARHPARDGGLARPRRPPAPVREPHARADRACCAVGVARAGLVGIVSWARWTMPPELQELAPFEAPMLDVYVVLLIVAVACLAAVAFGLSLPNAPMMSRGRAATASTSVVERMAVDYRLVSEHYFETFGIAVRKGRAFTEREAIARAPVAIVSEATARRLWPGREAIGETLRLDGDPRDHPPDAPPAPSREATVVGVVADVTGLQIAPPEAGVHAPASPLTTKATLSAWVDGDPDAARRLLLERITAIDPSVGMVVSMRSLRAVESYPVLVALWTSAILGGLALVLTVTGIVGIVSFLVAQRTREIGLRVALGATIGRIVRLVVWQSMRPAVGGLAAGLGLAWMLAAVVLAVPAMAIVGCAVDVLDPAAYALGIRAVSAVCLVAAALPALRGARGDPMTAARGLTTTRRAPPTRRRAARICRGQDAQPLYVASHQTWPNGSTTPPERSP